MPDKVNDVLALAQFITSSRDEDQSIAFLLALETLTLESWRTARNELCKSELVNHRTKEAYIKQIVVEFKNTDCDTNYYLRDLSLCPWFSPEAIELIFFHSATVYCCKKISSEITTQQRIPDQSSRMTNHTASTSTTQQQPPSTVVSSDNAIELSPTEYPDLSDRNQSAPTPPSDWATASRKNYQRRDKGNQRSNSRQRQTVYGSRPSPDSNIGHQLELVCLGVRSGPEETVESLKSALSKWTYLKHVKVDAVRKWDHGSTFRTQFYVPASLKLKWMEPAFWPSRMAAEKWRGSPKSVLTPPEQRELNLRVYVGNLKMGTTEEKITINMKKIYQNEIESGVIKEVKSHINQAGLDRALQIQAEDPSQIITKSACVVLTLNHGQDPEDIKLKLNHFPYDIRKTIRWWRGPTPQPRNEPEIDLAW